MKKILALTLAMLMVFALLTGCGKKDNAKTDNNDENDTSVKNSNTLVTLDKDQVHPSDDAVFKYANQGEPTSLCFLASNAASGPLTPITIFYDNLVAYDSTTNEIVPCLATEWEWIDSLTIRFKLRNDVKSHLGDPFTASDVLYTIDWGNSNAKCIGQYGSVFDFEKCRVIDDYTVELALKASNPFILLDMTRLMYPIVVEASVEKLGGREVAAENPLMGTGPYKLTNYDKVNMVFYAERNEDYWGTKPYYKKMEVYTVVDSTARSMGVEAGDYNACGAPTSNAVMAAIGSENVNAYITPGTASTRWDFNSDREPFNIKEFRQALCLAVNYEAISQVCFGGHTSPADSVVPYNTPGHSSPDEGEKEFYFYYDLERAKQKMVEAGFPNGTEIGVTFAAGKAEITSAVEIIQNGLKEIGITVRVEQYDSATTSEKRRNLEFDTMIGGVMNPTPTNALRMMDQRFDKNTGSQGLWMGDKKDYFYDLVDKCKTTTDLEKCYVYLDEFQDFLREYCPAVNIANYYNFNMTSPDIVNIGFDASGTLLPASFYPADYIAD